MLRRFLIISCRSSASVAFLRLSVLLSWRDLEEVAISFESAAAVA